MQSDVMASSSIFPVFLDFDGTVHPEPCTLEQLFVDLPRLEAVVRERIDVCIVICSAWRRYVTLVEMAANFSEDIRPRIIGVTPMLGTDSLSVQGLRRREASEFLRLRGLNPDRWVALDDSSHLWEPLDRRIIVCADGFGPDEESRLRNRLEGFGVS